MTVGVLYADIYTGVFSPSSCTLWNINIGSSDWGRVESSKLCLPTLTSEFLPGSFVTLQGIISSIDDSTAYTWEECDMCGSDQLATLPDTGSIICIACNTKVEVPKLKMKMEANVHIPSAHLTVKVDLSQKTIKSVLPTDVDDEGYDIDQVINHSLNCPVCLVQELLSDNKRCPKFSLLELNYNIT
ncbi:hypothetical protein Btru_073947 [Bulinus truncatus]|nr:hypothetical protein Btru_073947 [Bulinus truncatus]